MRCGGKINPRPLPLLLPSVNPAAFFLAKSRATAAMRCPTDVDLEFETLADDVIGRRFGSEHFRRRFGTQPLRSPPFPSIIWIVKW